ncbi:MAG: serine hydrolase [Clostridiales bacterium]|nr:serine hydrolase [Clostridiales bacterium]
MKLLIVVMIVALNLYSCEKSLESTNKIRDDRLIEDISNVDSSNLDEIIQKASEISNIVSLSISKGSSLEEVNFNYGSSYQNNVFSVTKSVTSLLVGIAIDQGYIGSVEDSIEMYIDFEKYGLDDRYKEITLHHLLVMSSGILWDSNNQSSEYFTLKGSLDPLEMIFERGVSYTPGSIFNYSDGSAYMVAVILQEATGVSLLEYATENLFFPLGIDEVKWQKSLTDVYYGGFDLYLTCEDMRVIGKLILNEGVKDNRQIVSKEWLERSLTSYANTGNSAFSDSYGYYWWLGDVQGFKTISALGHGGQFITIVPELELVITCGTLGAVQDSIASNQFVTLERLIKDEIIPFYIEGEQ